LISPCVHEIRRSSNCPWSLGAIGRESASEPREEADGVTSSVMRKGVDGQIDAIPTFEGEPPVLCSDGHCSLIRLGPDDRDRFHLCDTLSGIFKELLGFRGIDLTAGLSDLLRIRKTINPLAQALGRVGRAKIFDHRLG